LVQRRSVFDELDKLNSIFYNKDTTLRDTAFFFPESQNQLPPESVSRQILETAIYPTLLQGLTHLCKEKPAEPVVLFIKQELVGKLALGK
jgi:hypothetical protein